MNIKFTGDFKKLIPMGFEFCKLFASNYKVYHKNDIWIWVAQGGYVEIKDLYNNSGYVAKMFLDGTYPVWEEDTNKYDLIFFEKGRPKSCMMNEETGEILERDIFNKKYNLNILDHTPDHCRELLIPKRVFDTLEEIRDMIEIEKDK